MQEDPTDAGHGDFPGGVRASFAVPGLRAYRLDGTRPVRAPITPDLPLTVALFRDEVGPVAVSTIFLALDHSFRSDGPPVVFETCVFGPDGSDVTARYETYAQAEDGHRACVAQVRAAGT